MNVVRTTTFFTERRFEKVVNDFGPSSAAEVVNTLTEFQKAWLSGLSSDDLYNQFTYKPLRCRRHKTRRRAYRLHEIYAGSNRKHLVYRVAIMLYDNEACACWVHAFKKQNQSEPAEVALACKRADEFWDYIKGEQ